MDERRVALDEFYLRMSGLFGVELHNKINGSNVNYNRQRFCLCKLLKLIFEMYRALIIFVKYHFCEKSAWKRFLWNVTVLDKLLWPIFQSCTFPYSTACRMILQCPCISCIFFSILLIHA